MVFFNIKILLFQIHGWVFNIKTLLFQIHGWVFNIKTLLFQIHGRILCIWKNIGHNCFSQELINILLNISFSNLALIICGNYCREVKQTYRYNE